VNLKQPFIENGYTVVKNVFSTPEIDAITQIIHNTDSTNKTFRKSKELFAIRQFFKELHDVAPMIFTEKFKQVISEISDERYFVVKSIYFDKPGTSNWFVSYHQDLTISVDKKMDIEGFGPWSLKQNQFAVQPPLSSLENNFTIRIHLDDTDENNGALRVIPKSHLKAIYRPETIDWNLETEDVCIVPKGAIMIMRPLLLHASSRTTNDKRRRVIHIEFSKENLPESLQWAERLEF
jgi:ectoine hydroxylase-related dioxygenase (phytanoyl-CoA dioxygenase family)